MTIKKKTKQFALVVSGKRKTAIAKAVIKDGSGIIKVNKQPISHFSYLRRLSLEEPTRILQSLNLPLNFDISVNVKGGGVESQVEASRLAMARAILAFSKNPEIKRAFLQYDRALLVADVRRKETRKPGDSKARAARQKSYR
ncbi:30S ribosomal protein S9 [Candidatus Pacearchaeota archaeon]|nr:30S ribosomal protein S9 [Candidatus Pacearchaeota archaeon]